MNHITLIRRSVILLIFLFIIQNIRLTAQEAALIDETIYWEWQLPKWYLGNDHYCWHRTVDDATVSTINFGEMSPTDWTSPYDYVHGTFYLRFEVLEQPTNEDFTLMLGIWQDINHAGGWPETKSNVVYLSGGPGSSVEGSFGSPSAWFQKRPDLPVDYTRPEDFWRLGILLLVGDSICIPYAQGWTPGPITCGDAATQQLNFFPMRAKLTVVAVAAGHTFSGWANYPGGSHKPATPCYGIDYTNEQTNVVIASTDEYSYNSNMSGAVSGTGAKLALTPGQNIYFRTKAAGAVPASFIETLIVPERAATPTFVYDEMNQRTSTTVSSAYEHSNSPTMSGAVAGTGYYVSFTIGTTKYFRKKATASAFKSNVQSLITTVIPEYVIDYTNERISTPVISSHEYSYNQSIWTSGTNAFLSLTPGQDVYFRKKIIPANIQHVVVGSRPATPSFSIDYDNETTSASVSSEYHYSSHADMSADSTGTGQPIALSAGTTVYFRKAATTSAFASEKQTLNIPPRPPTPEITINFSSEMTSSISSDYFYSSQSDMSGSISGTGVSLLFPPGDTLYIQKKATGSAYKSAIQQLSVSARPAAPVIGIDFAYETTNKAVSSSYEISDNADMSGAFSGSGSKLSLVPGTDLYIRQKATATEYSGDILQLVVPERPLLTVAMPAPIIVTEVPVNITFSSPVTGFSTTDILVSNGIVDSVSGSFTAYVEPIEEGTVRLSIPANAVTEGNFTSFAVTFDYKKPSDLKSNINDSFSVYPTYVTDQIHVENSGSLSSIEYEIIDYRGVTVLLGNIAGPKAAIPVSGINQGLYMIRFISDQGSFKLFKFIKE